MLASTMFVVVLALCLVWYSEEQTRCGRAKGPIAILVYVMVPYDAVVFCVH